MLPRVDDDWQYIVSHYLRFSGANVEFVSIIDNPASSNSNVWVVAHYSASIFDNGQNWPKIGFQPWKSNRHIRGYDGVLVPLE
ncbi:hypothetical protein N483_09335 [Pseudoalteromonas luteoviolacea NCIMB 1944]|nr:hypothetical protein N483_09335 [Pseudoalteromonas luteoviolacea NCIMB 1944]